MYYKINYLCVKLVIYKRKIISLFSSQKVCSNSSRWSLAFIEGKEIMPTFRPYGVHISCKKCKLNPCLNKDTQIIFQLIVDIGKNKVKFVSKIVFITFA